MRSLEEQGFEIVPDILSRERMLSLGDSIEKSTVRRSRAGVRNALELGSVRTLANDPILLGLAKAVLGQQAVAFRATLFDKSPRSNWLVVWHQDTALPLQERREARGWGPWSVKQGVICAHAPTFALEAILAIRVHLDDSNNGNGSLRVLPRTHTRGVLTDDEIHDVATKIAAVDCHLSSGGLLLMRPLLIHASSKARSENARRRVLHFEYAAQTSFPDGVLLDMPDFTQ
jgi:ectoine hydroxylase-related dioxygenase (phytanoyl-CoA dioxygenase family)